MPAVMARIIIPTQDLKMADSPTVTAIKTALDRQADAVETFTRRQTERLDQFGTKIDGAIDRIEAIEAGATTPRKGGAAQPAPEYKTFHTANGPIYELPAHVRMQDVIAVKQPEISLERWLAATMAGERCMDQQALEFARERKQMVTTSTGVLIPAEYQSRWIDLIRSQMTLNAAGMRTVTMDAKSQTHSAVMTDPAVTWHSEAGSISPGNPTFALRVLTAKTVVVRCQGSVELAQDSPDFGAQLAGVMTRAIAHEIDRVGLVGSGIAPEPQGILGTDGVGTIASVGTPGDYSDLIEGVQDLLEANVPIDIATATAIMSPRTWATYEGLPTGITSDDSPLPRPRALQDMQFRVTTAVANTLGSSSPPTESAIFLGDFRSLLLGTRREAAVESLKLSSYGANLLLEFIAYARVDYVITRPSDFVVLTGVTA